jgi:hypothetical protein
VELAAAPRLDAVAAALGSAEVGGWELPSADLAIPLFCENLGRYLRGGVLRNVVDLERGY